MWRCRVPTPQDRADAAESDEAEPLSLAKFADADEDAPPLDRPSAPNCVDLRKLLRKGSSEDRYADLSFSSEDYSSGRKGSLHDRDNKGTVQRKVMSGTFEGHEKVKSNPRQHDCTFDRKKTDAASHPEDVRFRTSQKGLGKRSEDPANECGVVRRKGISPLRPSVGNGDKAVPDIGIGTEQRLGSDESKSSLPTNREAVRVIAVNNLFVKAYHLLRFLFTVVYQVLKNLVQLPLRIWQVGRRDLPLIEENLTDRTSRKSSDKSSKRVNSVYNERYMGEEECVMTKNVHEGSSFKPERPKMPERCLNETQFDAATSLGERNVYDPGFRPREKLSDIGFIDIDTDATRNKEDGIDAICSESGPSSAPPKALRSGMVDNFNELRNNVSFNEAKISSQVFCDDKEECVDDVHHLHNDNELGKYQYEQQELSVRWDDSIRARETLSEGTSAEEDDDDAWLWQKIKNSDNWTEAPETNPQQLTPVKDVPSPLRLETTRHLQCVINSSRMGSFERRSLFSPEPEARRIFQNEGAKTFAADEMDNNEHHLLVDGEMILPKQRWLPRKTSHKPSNLLVHETELQRQRSTEKGARRSIMSPRMASSNYEAIVFGDEHDPSNAQGSHQNPACGSGASTPRRKASKGNGIKSDMKAVTESMKRVFMRNRPEPDTRFASPRSAQKTLTIIADVMAKEFGCMVAVRKSGALKVKSEKIYSSDKRLRTCLRFRALDEFSCNVIISRARNDDFTVPTADYVTFVAGLQQKFLNTVTGAWRYQ